MNNTKLLTFTPTHDFLLIHGYIYNQKARNELMIAPPLQDSRMSLYSVRYYLPVTSTRKCSNFLDFVPFFDFE
jgi:hypothetical protein